MIYLSQVYYWLVTAVRLVCTYDLFVPSVLMVGHSSKAGKYDLFVPSVLMVGHSSTAGMYDLFVPSVLMVGHSNKA